MTSEKETELNSLVENLRTFCVANAVPVFMVYGKDNKDKGHVRNAEYGHMVLTPFEVGKEYDDDKIVKYSASLNSNFDLRIREQIAISESIEDVFDSFFE